MVGTFGGVGTNAYITAQSVHFSRLFAESFLRTFTLLLITLRRNGVAIGVIWRSRSDNVFFEVFSQCTEFFLLQILGHVAINIHSRTDVGMA